MPLEDHAGDIVRKAREGSGKSAASVAAIAGVASEVWGAFEQSGAVPAGAGPGLRAVASDLGLKVDRLLAVASGWQPAPRDLGVWRELRCITTTQHGNAVHCYLVWDEVTRGAAVFDTGWNADPILRLIQDEQLNLHHLFLTHLHDDHVGGMARLRAQFPKLRLHANSRKVPAEHRVRPEACIQLGSLRIMNRATPGHAEEGVIYTVGNWPEDAPHVAFVGDTIFAGSVATGFQSLDLLRISIRDQILVLPGETLLCPGHGPVTTVAEEREHNPFF